MLIYNEVISFLDFIHKAVVLEFGVLKPVMRIKIIGHDRTFALKKEQFDLFLLCFGPYAVYRWYVKVSFTYRSISALLRHLSAK